MNTQELAQRKRTLRLTRRQRELLYGKLLGDGHLETQNQGRTFRLKIEHAITQRPYVDWLANELPGWLQSPPRQWMRTVNGTPYRKYGFQTVSHGALRFLAHQFYDHGRKVVPHRIAQWLTPLVLAVWFMDDGSVKSNETNGRILNTQGFVRTDVERLARSLTQRYGIPATLRRQREGWQIFIPARGASRLAQVIGPHLHPHFRYKLPKLKETYVPKR